MNRRRVSRDNRVDLNELRSSRDTMLYIGVPLAGSAVMESMGLIDIFLPVWLTAIVATGTLAVAGFKTLHLLVMDI